MDATRRGGVLVVHSELARQGVSESQGYFWDHVRDGVEMRGDGGDEERSGYGELFEM